MRKRINTSLATPAPPAERRWLDLDEIAVVEISSEDSRHPIESALLPGQDEGWRATQSGQQSLRLLFDEPQTIEHVRLVFVENHHSRTQEFALRWSEDGESFREVVRQQYNFNPPATEVEEYQTGLQNVKALELVIIPDISGGASTASLSELRLA